jgi:hypothetical protein
LIGDIYQTPCLKKGVHDCLLYIKGVRKAISLSNPTIEDYGTSGKENAMNWYLHHQELFRFKGRKFFVDSVISKQQ